MAINNEKAVNLFRRYLQFKTVSGEGHVNGANEACVAFLDGLCKELGLKTQILPGHVDKKPVLLATWKGREPNLKSLLLNSHYDVVPVMDEAWTKPAWEGARLEDPSYPLGARIYGRGTQDMKCVGIQYLIAISRLKAEGYQPLRDVHLSYVPDEEVGGAGMGYLTRTDEFKALNVECALDEGLSNPTDDAYTVFYGERLPWWVEVEAKGPTGHGSRFIKGVATHCLHSWCKAALAYRKKNEEELHGSETEHGCGHAKCKKLGDVTTMNLTVLRAGVSSDEGKTFAVNVIPTSAKAFFDVRVPLTTKYQELEALFDEWAREAEKEWGAEEGAVQWRYGYDPIKEHHVTELSDKNPFWVTFRETVEVDGIRLEKEVFPAATDSRFLRELGIHALGFSPINKDPILLHEHDEYLSESVYVQGCAVYEKVIKAMAEVRSQ